MNAAPKERIFLGSLALPESGSGAAQSPGPGRGFSIVPHQAGITLVLTPWPGTLEAEVLTQKNL